MRGASNSQCLGDSVQASLSQGKDELAGGMARMTMSPGGSWRGWARA
jgi:hypothetical protein